MTGYESKRAAAQDKITDEQGRPMTYLGGKAQPAQEPVAWRNAAVRIGEELSSVGPDGYYDMTAKQWLDWALSVVTVHAPPPQRPWVGLTDEEIDQFHNWKDCTWSTNELVRHVEATLRSKNT